MDTKEFLSYVRKNDYFCLTQWVNHLYQRFEHERIEPSYLMCHELINNGFMITDIPHIRKLRALMLHLPLKIELITMAMNFIKAGLIFETLHATRQLEVYRERKKQAVADIVGSLDALTDKKILDFNEQKNTAIAAEEKITVFREHYDVMSQWRNRAEELGKIIQRAAQTNPTAAARLGVLENLKEQLSSEPLMTDRIKKVINGHIAIIDGLRLTNEERKGLACLKFEEKQSIVKQIGSSLWCNLIDIKTVSPSGKSGLQPRS